MLNGIAIWAAAALISTTTPVEPSREAETRSSPDIVINRAYELTRFHAENWDTVEDDVGRVYVANYDGVLVRAGNDWLLVQTRNATTVRSLSYWQDGRVYIGAQGELGYLGTSRHGELKFVSLADHLPADEQEFGDVWTTHAATNGVYFQTSYRVYFWDGASFTVYRSEGGYHTSFLIDDELIVRERGRGLVRLKNGQSELLPGGDFYAEKRVHVLMRETTGFLVGTRDNGFFRWNGEKSERVVTEADPILRRAWLYGSAELHTGEIALATLGAGVVVIDRQGKLTAHLNTANGAPDDNITSLYRLRSGLVVATTHNAGLFTFYSPSLLTEVAAFEFGAINDILLDSEYAFISTGGGGLTLSMDSVRAAVRGQRRPVGWGNGLKTSWTAVRAGGYVYAATEEGLFRTRADRMVADRAPSFTPVNSEFQVFALGTSGADTILAGYRRGLGVAKASVWHHQQEGTDIDELVSIVADASGIWATTRIDGVRLYGRPDPFGSPPVKYSVTDGLPANEKLVVVMAGGAPLYFTKEASGFYRFDASSGTFRKDYALAGNGIENAAVYDVHEASDGTIWLALSDGIARATPSRSGGFVIERPELLQFVRSRNTILATEPGGALWFTLDDRILRYEPSMEAPVDMEYNAILERIVSTATDSLLFGGFQSGTASRGLSRFDLELPHERRGIRVEFGTPMLFDIGRPVEYRTFLEGFDKDWQPWSQSTSRTISEEKEGEYVLRVEARNMYGIVSRDARVYLSILPPWYRSWWAYAIYLIGSVLVVTFTVKYRRMVKAQKRAHAQAEELARERRYSQRLQEANDQLKRANRLKDEFLATTSHELRTPITAILGFTEVLNNEIPADAPYREFVSIIEESGQRLMSTLTSLLDVARIRAGTMELVPQPVDLRETVRHSAETRRGQAEGKGLYFKVVLPEEPIDALQDPSAIERVIQHLLDNAVKFTEQGGITVEIGREGENASIRVHDTGLGIDAAFLPSLFEEFVQESDGERRSHNGNGLGLAIVGGLVRMMGGRVDVHSMKGVGSVFKVLVPIGGAESEPGSVVGAESGREYPGSELQRSGAGDRHPFGPTRLRKVTVPREARAD